jgi:hypothetical protein
VTREPQRHINFAGWRTFGYLLPAGAESIDIFNSFKFGVLSSKAEYGRWNLLSTISSRSRRMAYGCVLEAAVLLLFWSLVLCDRQVTLGVTVLCAACFGNFLDCRSHGKNLHPFFRTMGHRLLSPCLSDDDRRRIL